MLLREKEIKHEIRQLPIDVAHLRAEKRESGEMIAEGIAIVYDQITIIWGDEEVIARGAAAESIENDDIRAVWNHNNAIVLGRKKSGTLEIWEEKDGVHVRIHFPDSEEGRSKFKSIERGDVSQMSFAFDVIEGEWNVREEDEKTIWTRRIIKLKIYEVSPVTFPQYEETAIEARCKEMAFRDKPDPAAAGDDGTAVSEVYNDVKFLINNT